MFGMKEKRPYTPVSRDLALHVVRSWHAGKHSQAQLSAKYGISLGYINRLVHGDARPDVYAEVAREHAQDGAEA